MDTISKEKIITIPPKDVVIKGESLVISFRGKRYSFPFKDLSAKLAAASKAQREKFKVAPSGYGIHWPELDEDLAFGPLLKQAQAI